jgi:hypothetical protein
LADQIARRPAAADIEVLLTGRETKIAANQVQFVTLRLGEIPLGLSVVGAGIEPDFA